MLGNSTPVACRVRRADVTTGLGVDEVSSAPATCSA
jgi:hypothetical protein